MRQKNAKVLVGIGMWGGYVWMKTLAGLAIHPYKSIRRMVFSDKILLPVVLSPVMGIVMLLVLGRVGSQLFTLMGFGREITALVLGSALVGLLMWQILLAGLVVRFWRA